MSLDLTADGVGYVLKRGEGAASWFLDTRMTIKAGAEQTHGRIELSGLHDEHRETGSGEGGVGEDAEPCAGDRGGRAAVVAVQPPGADERETRAGGQHERQRRDEKAEDGGEAHHPIFPRAAWPAPSGSARRSGRWAPRSEADGASGGLPS